MVTDTQKSDMVRYLNEYCFDTIWSAMGSRYRANFTLTPATERLQTATFWYDNAVVGLPTTGMYRVFRISDAYFNGAWGPKDGIRYSSDQIANNEDVMFSAYDINGVLLPMCSVWLLSPPGSTSVFVAIEKNTLLAVIDNGINTTLYGSVFRNTRSDEQTWSVYSAKLTKATDADTAIGNALNTTNGGAFVVINGVCYTDLSTLPKRVVGDYVDVKIDPTILTEYVVAVDDTDNGYSSVKYSGDREILHCPKAQNPNQWILTHDNATLFVRDSITKKGVYLHRQDAVSVKQITHNDLSVSRTTLDAFKAGMGSTQIEVVVKVRVDESPRTLMSDSGWIADLYLSNDADIISHLRGVLDDTLTFWKASSLEQSGYVSLMFTDDGADTASKLDDYVAALGYYAVGAILSSNIYTGTYDKADMIITKSFAQVGNTVTPLVYIDGSKIGQSYVTITDHGDYRAGVSLTNSNTLSSGASVIIRTLDAGTSSPLRFTPSADNATLTLDSTYSSKIYLEKSDTPTLGYGRSSSTAYMYSPAGLNTYQIYTNTDGTREVTFASALYGQPVIIPPARYMWYKTENIDTILAAAKPVVIPLTIEASDETVVPLLGYGNIEVYVNGSYLVEDVDFTVSPAYGATTGGTMLVDVIINGSSYFNLTTSGNTVEVYASTDISPDQDVGYAVDNVLPRTNLISFWYPLISSAFVEGAPVQDLLDYAVYMQSTDNIGNGSLFELKPLLPQLTSNLLSDYSPLTDETNVQTINTYYGRTAPSYSTTVNLTVQHRLYSTFLSAVMTDVVAGNYVIIDDTNDSTFLAQFDAQYGYLKQRDPTLYNDDRRIDRRFLSIAANYAQPATGTSDQSRLIQRLITLTLITKPVTLEETLV